MILSNLFVNNFEFSKRSELSLYVLLQEDRYYKFNKWYSNALDSQTVIYGMKLLL